MRVSLAEALRLWRAYRKSWPRSRWGWALWVLFSRRVGELADPVWEGSVSDAGPAPEYAPTVRVREV